MGVAEASALLLLQRKGGDGPMIWINFDIKVVVTIKL
jgi:hypothetical protein